MARKFGAFAALSEVILLLICMCELLHT
jgi:hypothetical protein